MTSVSDTTDTSLTVDVEQFTARGCGQGDQRTVHVAGELDLAGRSLMMRTCLEGVHRSVVVELGELIFMDCAGYGSLVHVRNILEQLGGSLTLAHPTGEPARLLELIDELASQ